MNLLNQYNITNIVHFFLVILLEIIAVINNIIFIINLHKY